MSVLTSASPTFFPKRLTLPTDIQKKLATQQSQKNAQQQAQLKSFQSIQIKDDEELTSKQIKKQKQQKEKHTKTDKDFMNDIDFVWNDTGSNRQKYIIFIIVVLIIAFIVWASLATVDQLTRGQGQVIASSRTQVISHLEGGILNDIFITEGQVVQRGEVLAQVDNVAAASVFEDTQRKIYEHTAAIIRLQDELNEKKLEFPKELEEKVPDIINLQIQTDISRKNKYASELSVFQSKRQQVLHELAEMEERLSTSRQTLNISSRRLELARPAMAEGIYSRVDFLNLEQEVVRLRGEVTSIENNIAKTKSAIEEAKYNEELFKSEYRNNIITEISERTSERASLEKTFTTGSDRVQRTEVRSPMRGVVNRIILNTKGSAVKAGEPIMEIVPLDDTLLIEAKIRPSDIGFIYPNQQATVKLTAYDFSVFGGLGAFVEQISADTVSGQNNEQFYLVKLRTTDSSLIHNGEELPIIPGMVASVDILTGKNTIMNYLLKPILKAKDNALHER